MHRYVKIYNKTGLYYLFVNILFTDMLYVICVRIASLVLLFALLEGIINCPKWLSLNNESIYWPSETCFCASLFFQRGRDGGPWPNWSNGKYATDYGQLNSKNDYRTHAL